MKITRNLDEIFEGESKHDESHTARVSTQRINVTDGACYQWDAIEDYPWILELIKIEQWSTEELRYDFFLLKGRDALKSEFLFVVAK